MNRVKHLPNLFLCRPTSFSQCRKLFVDKPIRLRTVSLFARRVREHACASIQQRSRETRETLPPRAFSHMRVSRILLDGRRKKRLLVVYRPMGITEPGVTRTRLLCLGTKPQQQASNKQHMLNKDEWAKIRQMKERLC